MSVIDELEDTYDEIAVQPWPPDTPPGMHCWWDTYVPPGSFYATLSTADLTRLHQRGQVQVWNRRTRTPWQPPGHDATGGGR